MSNNPVMTQQIQLVELFNNNGEKMTFELLSKIEISSITYYLITAFDEDEATGKKPVVKGSPADVFILKEVEAGNANALEPLNDPRLLQLVFDVFKHTNSHKYTFHD